MTRKSLRPVVLYLDYDGVMHPDAVVLWRKKGIALEAPGSLFMYAPVLAELLTPFKDDLSIVLSTSWVHTFDFHRARKALPSIFLQSLVHGTTYHSEMNRLEWQALSRFEQINRHVQRHGVQHWVALDNDDKGWPSSHTDRLVLCDDQRALGDTATQAQLRDQLTQLAQLVTLCAQRANEQTNQ